MKKAFLALIIIFPMLGCSPEVGSEKWCASLKEKPTGDWTQTETAEYAKNCIIKFGGKD